MIFTPRADKFIASVERKRQMFDTKTEAFKEWDVPTPYTYPYDVFCDKHGELWSAVSTQTIAKGARVRVMSVDGLTLHVKLAGPS